MLKRESAELTLFLFVAVMETNVGTGLLDGPAENSTSMGEFFEYIAV